MSTGAEPAADLRYLARLTDECGVVEHALLTRPRRDEGYCTDDAGRLLALASRLGDDPHALRLATASLGFLERAHLGAARYRLRQRGSGHWTNDEVSDDATGRALLGLGTAAAWAPWPEVRDGAQRLFDVSWDLRSPHPRALAYAALGAVEVLGVAPTHFGASALLGRALTLLDGDGDDNGDDGDGGEWPWPEARLTYANALLPDAVLAAATSLQDTVRTERALSMLHWLLGRQVHQGHFSFVATAGADRGFTPPQFDQQGIEAWATADACVRAYRHSAEPRWAHGVQRAAAWYLGDNDVGVTMYDADSGGGYDGLRRDGVNLNQGAESSMAFVATMLALEALRA